MKKILIIDNDPAVLDMMQEALNYAGYEVSTAEDTHDIFSLITEHDPDLLLIDFILNGVNGGELCHQLKVDPRTTRLPVIIVTAYTKMFLSLGDYGCNGYLAKPFDLDELISQVNGFLAGPELVTV
jgi:CheY-like chemotaxis protein